jgi:hypothetical protein
MVRGCLWPLTLILPIASRDSGPGGIMLVPIRSIRTIGVWPITRNICIVGIGSETITPIPRSIIIRSGISIRGVSVSGSRIRGISISGSRIRGISISRISISGISIRGVNITPRSDSQYPERPQDHEYLSYHDGVPLAMYSDYDTGQHAYYVHNNHEHTANHSCRKRARTTKEHGRLRRNYLTVRVVSASLGGLMQ